MAKVFTMQPLKSKKAFTLMEIMVVVVIVGIIAAFGVANFQKTMDHEKFRRVQMELNRITGIIAIANSRENIPFTADIEGDIMTCGGNIKGDFYPLLEAFEGSSLPLTQLSPDFGYGYLGGAGVSQERVFVVEITSYAPASILRSFSLCPGKIFCNGYCPNWPTTQIF